MEWVNYLAVGLVGAVIASIFWIVFNVYRIEDLLIRCEEEKQVMRDEVDKAAQMVAKVEMQARVFGQHPVAKLIGGDE